MKRRCPPAVDTDCSRPLRAHSRMVTGDTMSKPAASNDVTYFLGLADMSTPLRALRSHIVYIESIVSCVFAYSSTPVTAGTGAVKHSFDIRMIGNVTK